MVIHKPDPATIPATVNTTFLDKNPKYDPAVVYVLELATCLALKDDETISVLGKMVADTLQNVIREASSAHHIIVSRAIYYLLSLLRQSHVSDYFFGIPEDFLMRKNSNNHSSAPQSFSTILPHWIGLLSKSPLHQLSKVSPVVSRARNLSKAKLSFHPTSGSSSEASSSFMRPPRKSLKSQNSSPMTLPTLTRITMSPSSHYSTTLLSPHILAQHSSNNKTELQRKVQNHRSNSRIDPTQR